MAGASVIGALRVVLGADTASLDKGLADSQSKLAAFGHGVGTAMLAVSAAVTAAAASIGIAIKGAIEEADKLNKLSQSTGVSVEELSKLKYAAELADVSSEALGKSIGKLSKAMVSAATEGASPAAQAFTAMGVSVKNQDGTLRSSSDVLKDLADKFSGYRDGAEKTSLAIALFGKAGAAMIPLLNLGRDGLQEAGDEAEKFGLVLDKKTTIAAEAFNDNLKRMDKIKDGLVMTITSRMLPAFEQLSEVMLEARENSTLMSTAADVLVGVLKGAIVVGLSLVAVIRSVGGELAALGSAAGALAKLDWQGFKDGMTAFAAAERASDQAGKDLTATISSLFAAAKAGDMGVTWGEQTLLLRSMNREVMELGKNWSQTTAPIVSAADAQRNALQTFLDSQAKRIAGQEAEAATIGKSVGEQAKLRLEYEAQAIAQAKGIALGPIQQAQIAAAGDAAAAAAMKIAAANINVQAMNPAEKFALDMAQLQTVYQNASMTMETFAARQQQIAEAAGATWGQASASIAGSFAMISGSFSKESSAMATAAKVFGVIQGTISMFTGAAKALELPFPANIAAVAAVLAKGASLVASIKSQSVPTGMMTGGSFTVPGSGGPDSQRVALDLTPGEQVDVWRPEQGGGADPRRGAGKATEVYLAMPIAATRDAFRSLIEGLNDAMSDGYRLNVVPA